MLVLDSRPYSALAGLGARLSFFFAPNRRTEGNLRDTNSKGSSNLFYQLADRKTICVSDKQRAADRDRARLVAVTFVLIGSPIWRQKI